MSPPDVSELSSHFSSVNMESDVTSGHGPINIPPPRFSLFKKKRQGDDSEAADDEAEDDAEATFTRVQDTRTTPTGPVRSETRVDPGITITPRSNFRPASSEEGPNDPPLESPSQLHRLTEEERLRRQLFDMQRINASFREYFAALGAVRDRHQSLVHKVESTKHLLDRYVAILGQAEHNTRLLLDPTWEGAEADAERIHETRAREEDEIRKVKEEELRREEERRRQEEEEQRKIAAAAAKRSTLRGRGPTVARATSVRGGPAAARRTGPPRAGHTSVGLNRPPSVMRGTPSTTGASGAGERGTASGISQSGIRPPSVVRGSIPRGVGRGNRGG